MDENLRRLEMQSMHDMSQMHRLDQQRRERQEELAGRHDAKAIYEHLARRVAHFERSLNEDEEIGLQLANFGLAAQLHIRQIGYQNPNLIEFHGLDPDKNEVTLVQHISQLSFMLIAVKPFKDEPYRIGFK